MEVDVLIVGGGPTGLVLACECARRGVHHRIIERGIAPAAGSRGKGTQPRSLEVFDDLGIVDRIIAGGRFNIPMMLHSSAGMRPAPMHEGPTFRPDAPYAVTLMTPQWHVEATLRARLTELGGGVEFGSRLLDLTQQADHVIATIDEGGRRRTTRARWVVGCDGGHSLVRDLIGASFLGETLEQHRMWVGDVKASGLDRDHWHVWQHSEGFLALCPLRSTDLFQFQASLGPEEFRNPSLAAFQELVERRTDRDDIKLPEAGWLSHWRANVRMVDRYRVGRIFLAGDAAHVHSPAGDRG